MNKNNREFHRKNIFRLRTLSMSELEDYYRLRRKYRFERGKRLRFIRFRLLLYPAFKLFLRLDRLARKQTVSVMGKYKKHRGQVIYACTHIGENDLENIYECLGRGCWWFVGDPCVLYKRVDGLMLYLNGSIFMETTDREDRRIAFLRSLELLRGGGALMIFPEGARNGSENLPVMPLFEGTARMALETGTEIIPVAIEQYDRHFIINFGDPILPWNYQDSTDLTEQLRNVLAALKWEIWESVGACRRDDFPIGYSQIFREEFVRRIAPYDTPETNERARFHTRAEREQREVSAYRERLIPSRENAFLFRQ